MSETRIFLKDDDPRVSYSGGWSSVPALGAGEHGEGAHVTSQVGASATLRFRGNGVVVFITLPRATDSSSPSSIVDALVTLDGNQYTFSKRASTSDNLFGQRAFQLNSGLDPNVEHTITISQRGSGSMPLRVDSFEFVVPGDGAPGPAAQPFSPDGTLTPLSGPLPNPAPPVPSQSQPTNTPATSSPSPTASSNTIPSSAPQDSPTPAPSVSTQPQFSESDSDSTATNSRSNDRITVTTDSRGVAITKILPSERVITSTDSTGGIILRTEAASAESSRGESPGTGTIIAIVLGIVVLLAMFGVVIGLLMRRKRRRNRKRSSSGRKDVEGYHEESGSGLHLSPYSVQKSPSASPTGEPKSAEDNVDYGQHRRVDSGMDDRSPSRSQISPSRMSELPTLPPPAYSPSVENLVSPTSKG